MGLGLWHRGRVEFFTGLFGLLVGIIAKAIFDARHARSESERVARREFYTEMLSLLISRRDAMRRLAFDPAGKPPPDIDEDRIHLHDARLALEASDKVRELAQPCYGIVQRFWAALGMGMPVTVDEHGLYRYHPTRSQDPEAKRLALSVSLGGIYDELVAAMKPLEAQARCELH